MSVEDTTVPIILKESARLEDFLNNDLLKRFGRKHNISDEYNMFKLKQEVVAKTALFPNVKKKYALHIVNLEGVPVDELDLKGLVTQRSDYPEVTKKAIVGLLNLVLKSEKLNLNKVNLFIEGTRERMLKRIVEHRLDLGKPVSYSKDEEDYKTTPYQVIAMEMWNQLEYQYFVKGTKGYCFKIKGLNHFEAPDKVREAWAKLDIKSKEYIAVPSEEPILPMYYDLDVDYTIDFIWNKRVAELLGSIIYEGTTGEQEDAVFDF